MYKKILKPWFIHNPLLIARAVLYDLGLVARGWNWVQTCFGTPIYCDTSKAIGRAIFKNGVYELPTSELVWRLLKDCASALFIDVGANVGYYSLLARKRLGVDGAIIAFEPMPKIHEKLLVNLQGQNVDMYPYAVSDKNGQAILNVPSDADTNDGISTLQACADAIDSFAVRTVSLDEFLDEEVLILKIDVEGHEYSVLSGAASLLAHGKVRNIIFEDHDISRSEVARLLAGFGYKIFSIGWDMKGLVLKPLGQPNSSLVLDAPNYIATLDVLRLEAETRSPGWHVLRRK